MSRPDGKVVLFSDATGHIGPATARLMLSEKARVFKRCIDQWEADGGRVLGPVEGTDEAENESVTSRLRSEREQFPRTDDPLDTHRERPPSGS